MSTNAIENLLRSAFAPYGNASAARGTDSLDTTAFDTHLRKSDPPPVNSVPPPPKAEAKPDKWEDTPDDSTEENSICETAATAPPVAPETKAPAETPSQDEASETAENTVTKAAQKETGGGGKNAQAPSTEIAEAAEVTASPAVTETAPPTDAASTAENIPDYGPRESDDPKDLGKITTPPVLVLEKQSRTTENTEKLAESTTAGIALELDPEATAITDKDDPDLKKATAAAVKKVVATPNTEKPAAPSKKVTESAASPAATTANSTETQPDELAVTTGDSADEHGPKSVPSPRKNSKAANATGKSVTTDESSSVDSTSGATPVSTETKPSNSIDSAAAALPAPEQSTAAADKPAATPAPPTITPIHETAASNRRSSLTLQPPNSERTSGGPRLTEMEQTRFVSRVARAFEAAQQRDGGEIRLRLSPPELGSLRLEVKLQGGIMSARLETETEAARTILLDQLPALKERLAEHNIRVESFDVNVADRRAGGGQAQTPDQSGNQPRFEQRRPAPVKTPVPQTIHEERTQPRPSGEKGRINVII